MARPADPLKIKKLKIIDTFTQFTHIFQNIYYLTGEMNLVSPQGLLLPQMSAVHVHGDTKRAINRSVHYYLNIEIIARTY